MPDTKVKLWFGREGRSGMLYTPQETSLRPRLLLAYADSAYASRIVRSFRRLGWEVHMAATAAEARRLIDVYAPNAVLLEIDLPDESGWSASARIAAAHPDQRVILLGERPEQASARLAAAGAAALVSRADGMEGLVRAVYGQTLAKAV
jgi:ActR/RegA family two-component response regulator